RRSPNNARTSAGVADVARSQSRWGWPRSASRIAPPTHHASWPARSSRSAISSTRGGGCRRFMASERGGSGVRVENSHANHTGEDRQRLQLPPGAADILYRIGQMFLSNSGGSALSDLEQILERSG